MRSLRTLTSVDDSRIVDVFDGSKDGANKVCGITDVVISMDRVIKGDGTNAS